LWSEGGEDEWNRFRSHHLFDPVAGTITEVTPPLSAEHTERPGEHLRCATLQSPLAHASQGAVLSVFRNFIIRHGLGSSVDDAGDDAVGSHDGKWVAVHHQKMM
jgi:hypothetical protein